jgi:UDP-N-acetylmuramate--alanine ligase
MKMPQTIGLVHFIGIGGIGMSGIAEVLHNLGYKVQGSDQADSANVQRLRDKGIECFVGHKAENLGAPRWSSFRRRSRRPIRSCSGARKAAADRAAGRDAGRTDALPPGGRHRRHAWQDDDDLDGRDAARSGRLDPTVINGGIINAYGTNARMGAGEWMVVEADESDGTFLKLPADIAVVTNIDPEHLDHYGTFDKVREAFRQFVENVPFYGFGVMCTDHPRCRRWSAASRTAASSPMAKTRRPTCAFENHRMDGAVSVFDVVIRDRKTERGDAIDDLRCRCPAGTTSRTRPRRSPSRMSSA